VGIDFEISAETVGSICFTLMQSSGKDVFMGQRPSLLCPHFGCREKKEGNSARREEVQDLHIAQSESRPSRLYGKAPDAGRVLPSMYHLFLNILSSRSSPSICRLTYSLLMIPSGSTRWMTSLKSLNLGYIASISFGFIECCLAQCGLPPCEARSAAKRSWNLR